MSKLNFGAVWVWTHLLFMRNLKM